MKSAATHWLNCPIGRLAYQHNGISAKTRVLMLHGWLDNKASFDPMMPYLDQFECVAIDMVGHGQSTHRESHSLYHYIDYVRDVGYVLDALGWDSCHLLGHSLGGAVALISASAFPKQVSSLAMIDILHPIVRAPHIGPTFLSKSLRQFAAFDPDRQKYFPDLPSAVRARLKAGTSEQTYKAAEIIMQAATEKTAKGYRLRSDARLNFRAPLMFDQEQVFAYIDALKQPALALLATKGIVLPHGDAQNTLAKFKLLNVRHFDGGHHVHMEHPKAIATAYVRFINALNKTDT